MTKHDKAEFIKKVRALDAPALRSLFEALKAEEAPLGMLMFVSKEYVDRCNGLTYRRVLN